MKSKSKLTLIIMLVILTTILSSCSFSIGHVGRSSTKSTHASFMLLTSNKQRSIQAEAGTTLQFDYRIHIEKGSFSAILQSPSGEELHHFTNNSTGTERLTLEESGKYTFVIQSKNAKGRYHFEWEIE